MTNKIKLKLFGCCFMLLIPLLINAQTPSDDPNWLQKDATESDEFNNGAVDLSKWSYLIGNQLTIGLSDGRTSEVTFDSEPGRDFIRFEAVESGGNYYTGYLESSVYNFGYGYYEIEARVSQVLGLWPTFWLWSNTVTSSCYEEIDIFEPGGCSTPIGDHSMNLWYDDSPTCSQSHIGGIRKFSSFTVHDVNMSNWHKYGMEWLPDRLVFYLDNIPQRIVPIDTVREVSDNQSKVLYLGLQVADDPCKPTATGHIGYYDVNYFRYYKMEWDETATVNTTSFPWSSFTYKVKKSYEISDSTAPTTGSFTLRATDFIEFISNTTIPNGCVLNAITHPRN